MKVDFRGVQATFLAPLWARAKQFDDKICAYINEHPQASVINVGAGLDTTFYCVDNGLIQWYDLDLPNVIDIRRQLPPELGRTTYLAAQRTSPDRFSKCHDRRNVKVVLVKHPIVDAVKRRVKPGSKVNHGRLRVLSEISPDLVIDLLRSHSVQQIRS